MGENVNKQKEKARAMRAGFLLGQQRQNHFSPASLFDN